jgi:hypothetical protein
MRTQERLPLDDGGIRKKIAILEQHPASSSDSFPVVVDVLVDVDGSFGNPKAVHVHEHVHEHVNVYGLFATSGIGRDAGDPSATSPLSFRRLYCSPPQT